MLFKREWAQRFMQLCLDVEGTQRKVLSEDLPIFVSPPEHHCFVVTKGYVKLVEARASGVRFVRLIIGRGSLFGRNPFKEAAFGGFSPGRNEQAIGHGPVEVLEVSCKALKDAAERNPELTKLLLESASVTAEFYERRLGWQQITPVRARLAATLRDMICYEGRRCTHGHTIDVRLTHQDLAELTGVARPVVSAALSRLRDEGLIEYTRSYFCVEDLSGLERASAFTL